MALDKKELLQHNKDIKTRMKAESWCISFDKKTDMLIIGTKFPKNSGNVYINENEGLSVRVGEDKKIYGFIIENYKNIFLKKNSKAFMFWLLFLPYTHMAGKILFIPIAVIITFYFKIFIAIKKLKTKNAIKEYCYNNLSDELQYNLA
jgi:hypothetical protein